MRYSGYLEYTATNKGLKHPKEWPAERLRFSILSNPVKSEVANWEDDTLVSFVPMEAVGEHGGMNLEEEKPIGDVYGGYTYFANGDIVIAKITPCFENGKGALAEGLKNGVGFGTTEFHVVRPLKGIYKRWLFYLTMSDAFRKIGASEMLGAGGQKRVPENFIKDFRTGIPAPTEQEKIADFLDWKTGQIDELISMKKQLIEKLKEKRIALITQAVTKGLNPNTHMRDSSIPWLGNVPQHWITPVLRWYLRTRSGDFISNDDVESEANIEHSTPVIGGNGVMGYTSRNNSGINTLVVGRVGAHCGNVHLVRGRCWVTDNALIIDLIDSTFIPEYLYWFLISLRLNDYANKNAQPLITGEIIKAQVAAIPPVIEQKEIVDFINQNTKQIDALITKNNQLIEKLTEYRTALITTATTGKIDVRNVKIGGVA